MHHLLGIILHPKKYARHEFYFVGIFCTSPSIPLPIPLRMIRKQPREIYRDACIRDRTSSQPGREQNCWPLEARYWLEIKGGVGRRMAVGVQRTVSQFEDKASRYRAHLKRQETWRLLARSCPDSIECNKA